MLFNSTTFILFFFLVLLAYYVVSNWKARKSILLFSSYVFYAAWNPPFVLLLWISTFIDWKAHHKIATSENKNTKRLFLLISIFTNIGLLAFFKYGEFLVTNFQSLSQLAGMKFEPIPFNIILPVGISFYTFQTLSCTIEAYSGKLKPVKSPLDFSLYVTFFPQLVAGPIVRVDELIPQFEEPKTFNIQRFSWGLFLITLGMFQKMVIADTLLSPVSDKVFDFAGMSTALDTWLGVFAFSGQIFCDFSGYSTCAIGAAICLGFSLPDNFKSPYASFGFSDFWKRWHITLSTWLRDFLYIPLGGNRAGKLKTLRNLIIVMFLGGLWHGASWTFVIWGLLHGIYLIVERLLVFTFKDKKIFEHPVLKLFIMLLTYLFVCIAWVFFRAQDFATAGKMLFSMTNAFNFGAKLLDGTSIAIVSITIILILITQFFFRNRSLESTVTKLPGILVILGWLAMLIAIIFTQGSNNVFLYFQF